MGISRRRTRSQLAKAALVFTGAAAAALIATSIGTSRADTHHTDQADLASTTARLDSPVVLDGEVLAIAVVGDRVVLGGNFTSAHNANDATIVEQSYLLAYDLATGLIDTDWRPVFDGEIRSIAVDHDGSKVFVGGLFTTIDGFAHPYLGAVHGGTGGVDSTFTVGTNKAVRALAIFGDRLYVGGKFTSINGLARSRLAAVDFAADAVDESFNIAVEDSTGADGGSSVRALDVTPDGSTLMSIHNDRIVGGELRTGVALIDLTGPLATVKPWHTDLYELNRCGPDGFTRLRGGAISPDGSYLVVISSGDDHPPGCDTAVAFPIEGEGEVEPLWVSRHFDTLESVEITWNAVYVGGHFSYQEAPGSTDPWPGETDVTYGASGARVLGADVVRREKLGALNPVDGKALYWPAHANGPRGVLAIVAVDRWLLIGHDGESVDHLPLGRHAMFGLPDPPDDGEVIHPAGLDREEPGPDQEERGPGYWMSEADGDLYGFGAAADVAASGATTVDIATDEEGSGLWILGTDGVVRPRGAAVWFGDLDIAMLEPGEIPSAISVRPAGDGYWIFTNRGRVTAFGAADFFGDVVQLDLVGPVVASVATTTGLGYWMIADDGGVFALGDAVFRGSTGGMSLAAAIVGMAPDPDGDGYWLVGADGGAFAFAAEFRGSIPGVLPGQQLQAPIVGLVSFGNGYVMLGSDGGAFSFSDLAFLGSLGAAPPNSPVVAIAAFG